MNHYYSVHTDIFISVHYNIKSPKTLHSFTSVKKTITFTSVNDNFTYYNNQVSIGSMAGEQYRYHGLTNKIPELETARNVNANFVIGPKVRTNTISKLKTAL